MIVHLDPAHKAANTPSTVGRSEPPPPHFFARLLDKMGGCTTRLGGHSLYMSSAEWIPVNKVRFVVVAERDDGTVAHTVAILVRGPNAKSRFNADAVRLLTRVLAPEARRSTVVETLALLIAEARDSLRASSPTVRDIVAAVAHGERGLAFRKPRGIPACLGPANWSPAWRDNARLVLEASRAGDTPRWADWSVRWLALKKEVRGVLKELWNQPEEEVIDGRGCV